MQRIERYGVIALVFLLVTILAVSLWGDGKEELFAAGGEVDGDRVAGAPAPDLPVARTSPISNRGASDRSLPTSDNSRALNAVPRDRSHSRNPNVLDPEPKPEPAQDPDRPRRGRRTLPVPGPARVAADLAPGDHVPTDTPARKRQTQARAVAGESTCVVGAGETLSQISQRELGTCKRWQEIAQLNGNLDPNKLRKGMILKLPPRDLQQAAKVVASAASPASSKAKGEVPSARRTYRVQRGDVLSVIAQRELGTAKRWKEIVELNPELDPNRLVVGAKLVLPGAKSRPRATQVAKVEVARAEPAIRQGGWSGAQSGGKVR